MTIRIRVKSMPTADMANHYVFWTPDGCLGHCRESITASILGRLWPMHIVPPAIEDDKTMQGIIKLLLGVSDAEFHHEGVWYNQKHNDRIAHPFEEKWCNRLPSLDFSNYYNRYWQRWYPDEIVNRMEVLESRQVDLQCSLKDIQNQLDELESKDYSKLKMNRGRHD